MPYKPKYCCQCGEKIDRIDWKLWTSRRFCELCETELGIYDWISRFLVGISLLFGLYGIGSYFQKPVAQLNVQSSQTAASNAKSNAAQPKAAAQVSGGNIQSPTQTINTTAPTKKSTAPATSDLKTRQDVALTAVAPEKVFFCGAQTKKGAMCSRRIKNGGRCWQHEGQTAMMPQEKLLAAR